MIRVMFVCHGNICRSPMAKYIFNDIVNKNNLTDLFEIDSSATSTEEIGNDLYNESKKVLNKHNISFDKHYAKVSRYPKFSEDTFKNCIDKLVRGERLEIRFKDHALSKNSPKAYKGARDFHVSSNIVVIYRLNDAYLKLQDIGSHQDLDLTESLFEE